MVKAQIYLCITIQTCRTKRNGNKCIPNFTPSSTFRGLTPAKWHLFQNFANSRLPMKKYPFFREKIGTSVVYVLLGSGRGGGGGGGGGLQQRSYFISSSYFRKWVYFRTSKSGVERYPRSCLTLPRLCWLQTICVPTTGTLPLSPKCYVYKLPLMPSWWNMQRGIFRESIYQAGLTKPGQGITIYDICVNNWITCQRMARYGYGTP